MTNFIRDDTDLPALKTTNVKPVTNAGQQLSVEDVNTLITALDEAKDYLRSGTLDAAALTTIPVLTSTTAAVTGTATIATAAITQATVTHIDAVADTAPSVGPEMDFKGYAGRWFHGIDVANTPTSRDLVIAGQRGTYSFSDGVTTNGSATLTSAAQGGFTTALIGSPISGTGIPVGTTISGVASATSLTMSANATASQTGVQVTITRTTSSDVVYMKHLGAIGPTLGIGVTPPDSSFRLQISPDDAAPTMGGMGIRVGPSQSGKAFDVKDSGGVSRFSIDSAFYLTGAHPIGGAVAVQADSVNARAILLTNNAKSIFYGITFPGGNVMRITYVTGGTDILDFESDGGLRHRSTKIGFFGATSAVKPTVTGSRGGNAALASLLTALAGLGLVVDSSS